MINAYPTPKSMKVVMPERAQQCWELYESESLIPLGDLAREAKFDCPVLATPSTVHLLAGGNLMGGADHVAYRIVSRLEEIYNASTWVRSVDAFIYVNHLDDGEIVELLVRSNYESPEPFVLITEHHV